MGQISQKLPKRGAWIGILRQTCKNLNLHSIETTASIPIKFWRKKWHLDCRYWCQCGPITRTSTDRSSDLQCFLIGRTTLKVAHYRGDSLSCEIPWAHKSILQSAFRLFQPFCEAYTSRKMQKYTDHAMWVTVAIGRIADFDTCTETDRYELVLMKKKDRQTNQAHRQTDRVTIIRLSLVAIRYDTIRYGRFTCAQKLTRWPA